MPVLTTIINDTRHSAFLTRIFFVLGDGQSGRQINVQHHFAHYYSNNYFFGFIKYSKSRDGIIINRIQVLPKDRGQGIGSRLVKSAIAKVNQDFYVYSMEVITVIVVKWVVIFCDRYREIN